MKSRMSLSSAALSAVIVLAWLGIQSPLEGQETVRLSLDHYMDLETVSGPQISPDGSRIVHMRSWFDMVNDRRESSIWMIETDGSRNRHLLMVQESDGHRTARASCSQPGGAQIHVR